MEKSPEAFRTISEVAELLQTPAHVLRFWESRFPQIRPVKRAGGRRYYRPADVALLAGIRRLLHDEGLTIRGVQKILREQGVRHVAGLSDAGYEVEEAPEAGYMHDVPEAELVEPAAPVIDLASRARPAERQPEAEPAEPDQSEPVEAAHAGIVMDSAEAAATAEAESDLASVLAQLEELTEPQAPGAGHAEPAEPLSGPEIILDSAEASARIETEAEIESVLAQLEELGERDTAKPDQPAADLAEPPEEEPTPAPAQADLFAAPPPQPPTPESDRSAAEAAEAPGVWLPTLLRALPPGALDHRQDAVLPLHTRLVALRKHLSDAIRPGRN